MADPAADERRILKTALARTNQCLSLEVLAAISEEPANAPVNPQSREHLRACVRCQNELALLREFQQASARPGEIADMAWIESELQRRSPEIAGKAIMTALAPQSLWDRVNSWLPARRWRALSVAAVALLVAVTVGVYFRSGAGPDQGSEAPIYRSQQFSTIAPAGEITDAPGDFRWQAVEGATKYRVRVIEVDRTEVWSTETGDTSVSIPPALREQMRPGRTFSWEVIARNGAGEQIASTNLQNFHISATTS